MSVIIGILGKTGVQDRIADGLSRLEYRGYDSAVGPIMSDASASVGQAVGAVSSNLGSEDDFLFCCLSEGDGCGPAKEFSEVSHS